MNPHPTRERGIVISFDHKRGFGKLRTEKGNLLFHLKTRKGDYRHKMWPKTGDTLLFERGPGIRQLDRDDAINWEFLDPKMEEVRTLRQGSKKQERYYPAHEQ